MIKKVQNSTFCAHQNGNFSYLSVQLLHFFSASQAFADTKCDYELKFAFFKFSILIMSGLCTMNSAQILAENANCEKAIEETWSILTVFTWHLNHSVHVVLLPSDSINKIYSCACGSFSMVLCQFCFV